MGFAFMPFYTGDYRRDTHHLTPLRHGVYVLLLMHCWDQQGPLPLDEEECAGIASCRTDDERAALRYVLDRYFVCMEDGYYQKRMQYEIEKASAISNIRKSAGRKGYQARAKHLLSKSQARASTPTTTTRTTTRTTKDLGRGALSQGGTPLASRDKSRSAGEPPKPVFKISIPLNDGTEFGVSETLVAELDQLYPAVDVAQTLNEIRGWNLANPSKRKTRRGVLHHINAWLAKEQNRG